uniref:Uncharacterized protein n=1 Tax=Lepeophtheirus salmonis TaxID=72036 RepID=A0A0K2UV29_LEPSM
MLNTKYRSPSHSNSLVSPNIPDNSVIRTLVYFEKSKFFFSLKKLSY